ncbi:MAG TPA: class I SAM-dependent methyltransferase, partial [Chloroflexia bacterium]|nr:class I SAM-dependent methyltransferase [Chloroflexia bacterium]
HRWKRDHIGHIQILTTGSMRRILESHGLRVRDVSFSFHLLGQIHDVVDYWQREQLAGGRARTPLAQTAVKLVSRAVFFPTWRLAYYEDRLRRHDPRAVGVHFTAVKQTAA